MKIFIFFTFLPLLFCTQGNLTLDGILTDLNDYLDVIIAHINNIKKLQINIATCSRKHQIEFKKIVKDVKINLRKKDKKTNFLTLMKKYFVMPLFYNIISFLFDILVSEKPEKSIIRRLETNLKNFIHKNKNISDDEIPKIKIVIKNIKTVFLFFMKESEDLFVAKNNIINIEILPKEDKDFLYPRQKNIIIGRKSDYSTILFGIFVMLVSLVFSLCCIFWAIFKF
ncbi:hypothetical protein SLOPH_774 [Spraguea lophii 42_110]|uniref:Uncharacterized protein n=1 Tax=Spraguea lophii (strain 42_110) TaxID=1358809 RepID=S7XKA6_SPRLO|nr:hypothetical protein SLOPH_774 [Spraguea lophii 42_110]